MPRVPTLTQQSVMPGQPYSNTAPIQVSPDYSTAKAVAGIGRELAQVAGQGLNLVQAEKERATKEADDLADAEAQLAFDSKAQQLFVGFRTQQKGLAASASSADVIDKLDAARQEVAAGLANERVRTRFLTRSAQSLQTYRRGVEEHVGREFEDARGATLKARESQLLAMSESGIPDAGAWLEMKRAVEADVRGLAPSPEAAEATVKELESKAGAALVRGLLAQGKLDAAQKFVDEQRPALGNRYAETKTLVDRATAGVKADRKTEELQELVSTSMSALRSEGEEYISEEKLRGAVPLEGYDADTRKELEGHLREAVRLERERREADIKTQQDVALRSDGQRRPIPGDTKAFLWKHDPHFMRGLEAQREARWKAQKREAEGTAREQAEARRAQAAFDEEFRNRYNALPREEQLRTPPEVFAVQFSARKKELGLDVAVSPLGLSAAAKDQETSRRALETGADSDEEGFRRDIEGRFRALMKPKGRGAKLNEEQLQQRVGNALRERRKWAAANNGKLDPQGEKELMARLVRDVVVEPGTEVDLGITSFRMGEKRGLGVDLVEPAPPAEPELPGPVRPPAGPVRVRFPDGSVHAVPPEKLQMAKQKGGVVLDG